MGRVPVRISTGGKIEGNTHIWAPTASMPEAADCSALRLRTVTTRALSWTGNELVAACLKEGSNESASWTAPKARGLLAITSTATNLTPCDLTKDHGALSMTLASNKTWLMLVRAPGGWTDQLSLYSAFDYAGTTPRQASKDLVLRLPPRSHNQAASTLLAWGCADFSVLRHRLVDI